MGEVNCNKEPSQQGFWGGHIICLHTRLAGTVESTRPDVGNLDSSVVTATNLQFSLVILSDLQFFSSENLQDLIS